MDPFTNQPPQRSWTVVIPVKMLTEAKSRLMPSADRPPAEALALAFLLDTIAAARATEAVAEILVVTGDRRVADVARAHGCSVVDDSAHPGINAAAAHAAALRLPGTCVAVLVSDLPCLTPRALTAVLSAAAAPATAFLADADGVGTAMWFATDEGGDGPHFGGRSRDRHVAAGAVDLVACHPEAVDDWLPARLDVDTQAALVTAQRVGLGSHSRAVLADGAGVPYIVTVMERDQSTVTVVDEDGCVGTVGWPSVEAAGLVDVRRGQRLLLVVQAGDLRVSLP